MGKAFYYATQFVNDIEIEQYVKTLNNPRHVILEDDIFGIAVAN